MSERGATVGCRTHVTAFRLGWSDSGQNESMSDRWRLYRVPQDASLGSTPAWREHPLGTGGAYPKSAGHKGRAGSNTVGLSPGLTRIEDKDGFDSPMKTLRSMTLALFHTTGDMMTVILRIDAGASSNPLLLARFIDTLLSDLVSVTISLAMLTSSFSTVWHTGCPMYGCEGLRVLGTRQMTGWGLGIPEIGRTGIFSPRNDYWHSFQANPQQPT